MKTIFPRNVLFTLLLLTIMIISTAWGADRPPVIRNWSDDETKTKVKDSRDNIFQERVNNQTILKNTPKQCLATITADLKNKTMWQPKWHYTGAGTVRLPNACISPDRSLLTVIENIGSPGAPSSSRLILINCYNFKIVRVIELPEQLLTALCYIPGTNQLVATVDRQQSLKQSFGFTIIDLTGKTAPRKIKTNTKITALTCSNQKLFVAFSDGKVSCFDLENLNAPDEKINLFKNITALAFHADTNRLLASGNGKLNYLKLSTMAADIYAETDLPVSFKPNKITIIDHKGNCVLLESNRQLVLAKNRQTRELEPVPGTTINVNSANSLLAVGMRHKQILQLYKLPETEKLKPCEPRKLKDKTNGDIIMLAFLPEPMQEPVIPPKTPKKNRKIKKRKIKVKKPIAPVTRLLIIDSHGNIYKLKYLKKRWHKTLLIKPKK